jgi:predicted alpha/beta superfamily hydrolase
MSGKSLPRHIYVTVTLALIVLHEHMYFVFDCDSTLKLNNMKKQLHPFYLYVFVLLIFPFFISAQIISKEPKDLFIVGTESITFKSEINAKEYKLYVNLPENYTEDSTKTYSVFYALDAHWRFGSATSIYNDLRADGFVPELIIIGITYAGENPNYGLLRGEDLTPTAMAFKKSSGGAQKFLGVLSKEIIPMIDSLYRTDKTDRKLAGTSYGGLFSHYVLFSQPGLFNGYLINNASFWWDNDYSFKLEEEFYKGNKSLNARVLFVGGEYDHGLSNTKRMFNQIKEHHYENLELNFHLDEDVAHSGGNVEAMLKGMRFIYKRPAILLPEDELIEYCGTYQNGDKMLEIVIRDGELTLIQESQPDGVKIQALNKSEFTLLGRYFDFHFNRNEEGKVIGFFSRTSRRRSLTAVKIK